MNTTDSTTLTTAPAVVQRRHTYTSSRLRLAGRQVWFIPLADERGVCR